MLGPDLTRPRRPCPTCEERSATLGGPCSVCVHHGRHTDWAPDESEPETADSEEPEQATLGGTA
jgi:hypothetical protein